MCISILSDNKVVTCPLLMEQIWLLPGYHELTVTEVYDVIIRNEDEESLSGFWVLYPHDLNRGDSEVPAITPLVIVPNQPSRFNWYFVEEPTWIAAPDRLRISIPSQEHEVASRSQPVSFDCVRLRADVKWSEKLQGDRQLGVLKSIKKTLFRVDFGRPLGSGEVGFLRLQIRPAQAGMDTCSQIRESVNPSGGHPYRFSWEFRLDSPDIVRSNTRTAFESAERGKLDTDAVSRLLQVREEFRSVVIGKCGDSSVRILSHRIAVVIAETEVELNQVTSQGSVTSLGVTTAFCVDDDGTRNDRYAMAWLAGSDVNPKNDVLHTVARIRDFILHKNRRASISELMTLIVNDQHEAFGTLVSAMESVGLLTSDDDSGGDYGWAFPDENCLEYRRSINRLRRIYDAPKRHLAEVNEKHLSLYRYYKNLHPFSLCLRVTWEYVLPQHVNMAKWRAWRIWIYNTVTLVIAITALILTIVSLL